MRLPSLRRPAEVASVAPIQPDVADSLDGVFGAAVTAAEGNLSGLITEQRWPGLVEALHQALAGIEAIESASLVSQAEAERLDSDVVVSHELRVICTGTEVSLRDHLVPVLAAHGSPNTQAHWVTADDPLILDPRLGVALKGRAGTQVGFGRVPAERMFTALPHSGMRSLPVAHAWHGLLPYDLGRIALGVRRAEHDRYIVLVESTVIRPEHLAAIAPMFGDGRVDHLALRPVEAGDPVMGDDRFVFPIRRYPHAPRSVGLLAAEALPIDRLELTEADIEAIRQVLADRGSSPAAVVPVEQRTIGSGEVKTLARDPVTLNTVDKVFFEWTAPVVLIEEPAFAWGGPGGLQGAAASRATEEAIAAVIGPDRVTVAFTTSSDPVIASSDHSTRIR